MAKISQNPNYRYKLHTDNTYDYKFSREGERWWFDYQIKNSDINYTRTSVK